MKFEERKGLFEQELTAIMEKHSVDVYPANVVMPSGEVMPMIKIADTKEPNKEEVKKEDEDKAKK